MSCVFTVPSVNRNGISSNNVQKALNNPFIPEDCKICTKMFVKKYGSLSFNRGYDSYIFFILNGI